MYLGVGRQRAFCPECKSTNIELEIKLPEMKYKIKIEIEPDED